jgi:hypothetical protein
MSDNLVTTVRQNNRKETRNNKKIYIKNGGKLLRNVGLWSQKQKTASIRKKAK